MRNRYFIIDPDRPDHSQTFAGFDYLGKPTWAALRDNRAICYYFEHTALKVREILEKRENRQFQVCSIFAT